MKIYDGHNESGELVYFEVANSFLSRKAAIKIIKEIPKVEVLKVEKRADIFCTFKVGDRTFEITEPWGDNSRFHIGELGEVQSSNELQIIKQRFSAHKSNLLAIFDR